MFRVDTKQAVIDHMSGTGSPGGKLSDAAEGIASQPVESGYSHKVVAGVAQLIEAGVLFVIGMAIFALYLNFNQPELYIPLALGTTLLANIAFNVARTHSIAAYRTLYLQSLRVLLGWALVILLVVAALYAFKAGELVSRVWLATWFLAGSVGLVAFRFALRAVVLRWSRQGRLRRRTVVVGGGEAAETLIGALQSGSSGDIELLGLFDDRDEKRSPPVVAGIPKLGKVSDLVGFSRRARIDLIIVSMPLSAEARLLTMLRQLWILPVDIRLSAHMSKLRFTDKTYSYIGNLPVFEIADRPISDWNRIFKWMFDKIVALIALIVLMPVMIGTAIAIKATSKGPVFFRQKRHGFNNNLIEIYKFRSMYVETADAAASRLVTRQDPRVTPVGRFIRRTSIDELPQLLNVLKGELSIVGPRPHALEAKAANKLYHEAVEGYFGRHKVKPGITGWAQIHGWRGETDTIEKIMQRVDHDLYYIENWTLLLDLYILAMTPVSLLTKNENAF
ncbi:undecaprenyl-phosphate glucose phosphotransferase [Pelagibacterium montanilacus]|uniref:undecaprenyl-phosphate glucose phosphotransferase n=1 Tax=Pelagibacterium montanilacus TaxID=2185280 RepID=UPI000F8D1702|nr:undecaprenyl-phosphate glucose phosphotransferase [Pelagibacterium montanilacus]